MSRFTRILRGIRTRVVEYLTPNYYILFGFDAGESKDGGRRNAGSACIEFNHRPSRTELTNIVKEKFPHLEGVAITSYHEFKNKRQFKNFKQ